MKNELQMKSNKTKKIYKRHADDVFVIISGAPQAQLKQGNEETKEAVEAKSNPRGQALTRNKA